MKIVIIDLRCLQDPKQAERGIAVHARNIISLARQVSPLAQQSRIIGIINPALPALPAIVHNWVDEIKPNAYFPSIVPGTIFLNPSPKTADQIFISRILLDKNVIKAVLVYDFIPLENQEDYLGNRVVRLDYFTSMLWLNRYDLFLPISEFTQTRLATHLSLGVRPAVVTGVALPPWLENATAKPSGDQHILVVAGNDIRKNPELVICAHANSRYMQNQNIKIVIAGKYPPCKQDEFRALALRQGGNPDLLSVPGLVSQDELLARYRNALCVVTPSRAEGFSLPVIEAMAAGVPSIVSDIPAHAALVKDPAWRFGVDDASGLSQLLEQLTDNAELRANIVSEQAKIWPLYAGAAVARTTWDAIAAMALPKAFINTGKKPRVAILSPLPPTQSGVADYTAACASALQKYADVSLFAHDKVSAVTHISRQYDRVVSVMGNGYHHKQIFDLLQCYGGACIAHDARLMHFYVQRYGMDLAANMASAECKRAVTAAEIQLWLDNEMLREASFMKEIAEASTPLILHTQHSVDLVRTRFKTSVAYLPFAVYRPWPEEALMAEMRRQARVRLGMKDGEIHIISFGFIGAAKGLLPGLQMLRTLHMRNIKVTLHWLGNSAEPLEPWQIMAQDLGISAQVIFHNKFIPDALYRDYLRAADFGLQLRIVGKGNISGALQDCIAAGLPSVADNDLAESLGAPSYVRRVETSGDPALIADAFAEMITQGLHQHRYLVARKDYCARNSMDHYAKRLCEVLDL